MSKRDKIAKIKEYIKNLVVQELNKEEELEEVSTTATAGIDGTGTGHYDTPMAFSGKSKKSKKKKKKISHASGMKPVNESQPFADFTQFPKLSRDQQESLDELFGFAESYQIYNAFEKDPKKFIQTLNDMAKIRKASNKKPKGVNFNKGKKEFVKEATKQEVNALKKFIKDFDKMQKQYWNIAKMGDKELTNTKYNKHYETILAAQKSFVKLTREIQNKQMMGEGLNEGRYHDWRNDESLTPKQKIGKSMREIRDALNELDKTVKMNLKLKTELKMDSRDYWKNTHKALSSISERLVRLASRVGNLR